MHNMTMTQLSLSIYIELNYDAKCSTDDLCVCLPLKSCGIILEKKSRNLGQPERHNIPNKSLRRPEIISLKLGTQELRIEYRFLVPKHMRK
jgi:hypothetical protein